MRGHPSHPERSVMRIGDVEVQYYLREPSPDHWNAVGIITDPDRRAGYRTSQHCQMIVGVGASREEAIGDLVTRTRARSKMTLPLQEATSNVSEALGFR
jgi:hypothetical protein